MTNKEIYKSVKQYGSERFTEGFKQGFVEGEKKAKKTYDDLFNAHGRLCKDMMFWSRYTKNQATYMQCGIYAVKVGDGVYLIEAESEEKALEKVFGSNV